MCAKEKQLRSRLNLILDKEVEEMSNVLRQKYHINISSLCREAIRDAYHSRLETEVDDE